MWQSFACSSKWDMENWCRSAFFSRAMSVCSVWALFQRIVNSSIWWTSALDNALRRRDGAKSVALTQICKLDGRTTSEVQTAKLSCAARAPWCSELSWVGLRLERLGFALVTLTITRVRNLCDMFRECCVYKLVVSHLRKLKNAICAQNWPNKSQTARSLTITQPPFLFVCFLGTSLPDPVLTSFKFRPLCTGTVAKSVNAPSLANWTAEMQI